VQAPSSARILEQSLAGFRGRLTAADAAARSGLPTRDAAEGLVRLGAECGGHLAVTEKGELIYEFPRGLVRADGPGLARRIGRALARAAFGLVRFVVRAWMSVVLLGYVILFAGVLIFIAAKSEEGIGDVLALLARVLFEALYWTFHPFSPVYLANEPRWVQGRKLGKKDKKDKKVGEIPFYERVNRFVFGPPPPLLDPRADLAKAVVEIRRLRGRVVPADIMRVMGGSREAAERTLLRLVADHEGEITVSEEGAILYEFPALRSTAAAPSQLAPAGGVPIWTELAKVPPLTGNSLGFNVLFSTLNGFNLVMGGVALAKGWTIQQLIEIGIRVGVEDAPPLPPPDGIPLVLGLVPFVFSAALFAIPLLRALGRSKTEARVARDNDVRLVLRRLLAEPEDRRRFRFTPSELRDACMIPGRRVDDADIERAVRTLGGTVDLTDGGALVYTFDDLAREQAAVRAARALASPDEAAPGAVLLSSSDT
jgi:hypothetical protein